MYSTIRMLFLCLSCVVLLPACINGEKTKEERSKVQEMPTGKDNYFCFRLMNNNQTIVDLDLTDQKIKQGIIALLKPAQAKAQGHDFKITMPDSQKQFQLCVANYRKGFAPSISPDQCPFCAIVRGEKPEQVIVENDKVIAFEKIPKRTPVNFLIAPKKHVKNLKELDFSKQEDQEIFIQMLAMAQQLARKAQQQGATGTFSLLINNGPNAGQTRWHLHMHVQSPDQTWTT